MKNNQTMKTFFKDLAEQMQQGHEMKLTISKTGDNILSVFASTKGADFIASGTPEEFDEQFVEQINKAKTQQTFSFKGIEKPVKKTGEEEEEEEELDGNNETADAKPLGKGKTKAAPKKSGNPAVKAEKKKAEKAKVEIPAPASEGEEIPDLTEEESPEEIIPGEVVDEEAALKIKQIELDEAIAAANLEKAKAYDQLMIDGERLLHDRNFEEAKVSYAQALELFPEDEKAKAQHTKVVNILEAMGTTDLLR